MGLRVQLLPPHESGLRSKFFNTTPYVLCRICNESGLAFHVAAVKYRQERENNTQANPFYSPMLECSDKGGLLPLPLLYDYQYVLGRLTIKRCPNRLWQAWNKLRFCSVGGNIRKRCTSPWNRPSAAEPATEVECVFVLAQTGTHSILLSVNFFFFLVF